MGSRGGQQALDQNKRSIDSDPEIDPDRLHLTNIIVAGRIPQEILFYRGCCDGWRGSPMPGARCALPCILVCCSPSVSRVRRASVLDRACTSITSADCPDYLFPGYHSLEKFYWPVKSDLGSRDW